MTVSTPSHSPPKPWGSSSAYLSEARAAYLVVRHGANWPGPQRTLQISDRVAARILDVGQETRRIRIESGYFPSCAGTKTETCSWARPQPDKAHTPGCGSGPD